MLLGGATRRRGFPNPQKKSADFEFCVVKSKRDWGYGEIKYLTRSVGGLQTGAFPRYSRHPNWSVMESSPGPV